MTNPSAAAVAYARRGWPVIPLHTVRIGQCSCGAADCGSPGKHPRLPHGLKEASIDETVIAQWWDRWPAANVGITTGTTSGVLVVDFDNYKDPNLLARFEERFGPLPPTARVRTGGGGEHAYFAFPGEHVPNSAGKLMPHVDVRADGGYVVAPPSNHTAGHYAWTAGTSQDTVLAPVPEAILEALRLSEPTALAPRVTGAPLNGDGSPYGREALRQELARIAQAAEGTRNDTLNQAAFVIGQLVAGGEVPESGAEAELIRAGVSTGLSELEVRRTVASGLSGGKREPRSAPERAWTNPARAVTATDKPPDPQAPGPVTEKKLPTSWAPLTLAPLLAGDQLESEPSVGIRTDGRCLFYSEKINDIHGEPETGKGWLTKMVSAEVIAQGFNVVYIDLEDDPASMVAGLRALGASSESIVRNFHYLRPDEPLMGRAGVEFWTWFEDLSPALVVLNGVTEFYGLHGLNLKDNGDAAKALDLLPRRAVRMTGAAMLQVDHVVKSKDDRGRFALGAGHKLAGIDGAAYSVEILDPLGRGLHGKVRLTVVKDRPGFVRQFAAGGKVAAEMHLVSTGNGPLAAELRPPASGEQFRPTVLMERLSRFMEDGRERSQHDTLGGVGGKQAYKRQALEALVEGKYLSKGQGGRGALLYKSLRPFRDDSEATE